MFFYERQIRSAVQNAGYSRIAIVHAMLRERELTGLIDAAPHTDTTSSAKPV